MTGFMRPCGFEAGSAIPSAWQVGSRRVGTAHARLCPPTELPKARQTCLICLQKSRGNEMAIMMPEADAAVLARRDAIVAALRAIVPGEGVIDSAAEMIP